MQLMTKVQISKNFSLSEFQVGYEGDCIIYPDDRLISLLQLLRDDIAVPITITSGARTFFKHASIYNFDTKKIIWNSRHLPSFKSNKLRAVDIVQNKYTYESLKFRLLDLRDTYMPDVKIGVGVSDNFLHLDVDRKYDAVWNYEPN
jgi:hypothetical protein